MIEELCRLCRRWQDDIKYLQEEFELDLLNFAERNRDELVRESRYKQINNCALESTEQAVEELNNEFNKIDIDLEKKGPDIRMLWYFMSGLPSVDVWASLWHEMKFAKYQEYKQRIADLLWDFSSLVISIYLKKTSYQKLEK